MQSKTDRHLAAIRLHMAELWRLQNFPASTPLHLHRLCQCRLTVSNACYPSTTGHTRLGTLLQLFWSKCAWKACAYLQTKIYWALTLHKHLFWTVNHHSVEAIPQGQQSYDMTILRTSHIPAYENVDPLFTKSTTASKSTDKSTKF